ncbi:MAG: rod-binding protein [Nitrospinaceae bacterium]
MESLATLKVQENALDRLSDYKLGQIKNEGQSLETKSDQELQQLANQFEAIFVNLLLKSMRNTIPKSGFMDSFSLDMYQSMFDEEVSKEISQEKGMGLSEILYQQLSRERQALQDNGKAPATGEGNGTIQTVR